jgi:hypothetical protein
MSEALAFSDRVLFALSRRRRTTRRLSRMFGRDIQSVYGVLEGLEDQGLVTRYDEDHPAVFELADGVDITYRPGRDASEVRIAGTGEDPRRDGDPDRCTAVTTVGERCKKDAVSEGLCGIHGS